MPRVSARGIGRQGGWVLAGVPPLPQQLRALPTWRLCGTAAPRRPPWALPFLTPGSKRMMQSDEGREELAQGSFDLDKDHGARGRGGSAAAGLGGSAAGAGLPSSRGFLGLGPPPAGWGGRPQASPRQVHRARTRALLHQLETGHVLRYLHRMRGLSSLTLREETPNGYAMVSVRVYMCGV